MRSIAMIDCTRPRRRASQARRLNGCRAEAQCFQSFRNFRARFARPLSAFYTPRAMNKRDRAAAASATSARAATGTNGGLAGLIGCIAPQLAAVDARFHEELVSSISCVNTLVKHVSRFRGKMLRPTLLLLTGKAAAPERALTDAHVTLATVVEMVHMATLVHDDVLDEAELRRKGATINHLRGNEAAVLLGDYLISHSYHLCSSLDSQFAAQLIARTTNQVCEGELLQIDNRNNLDLDEETYFQIITRKTASLCATCCLLGAKYAGATELQVSQLELFGLSLGIAFQIQDDILDL